MNNMKLSQAKLFYNLLFIQLLICLGVSGQGIVLSLPGTTGEYFSNQSVTLLPGFQSSGPFRAFITIPPGGSFSSEQNYISERTYKVASVLEIANPELTQQSSYIQYIDGLGRPLQSLEVKASPTGNDIVQPVLYDSFGRETIKYLPYAEQSGEGSYRTNAISRQAQFFGSSGWDIAVSKTEAPYSKSILESSPLSRVNEIGGPGMVWQPASTRNTTSGRTILFTYRTNGASSGNNGTTGYGVRLWNAVPVTGQTYKKTLTTIENYAIGQLFLNITKDENWTSTDVKKGTVEEYTDRAGRIVLERTFNTDLSVASTYYVYDDAGNLCFVLTPGANPDAGLPSQSILDQFCYQYRYDGKNRMIEKKIPGKGWEYFVYNQRNEPVLSQDSVQRSNGTWTFFKYDVLGRNILSGLFTSTSSRSTLQAVINSESFYFESPQTTGIGYTSIAFPQTISSYLTVLYYDNYTFPGASTYPFTASNKLNGLLTGARTYVLGTSNALLSINYYDDEGRVVKIIAQHYQGGTIITNNYEETINTYNFESELLNKTRNFYVGGIQKLYVYNTYSYDHRGRLIDTKQKTGDNASTANPLVLLSRNEYNEIGQLKSKALHSTNNGVSFAQTIKYRYNPRGWMEAASAPLFSIELKYDLDSAGLTPQYNGNISRQKWGIGTSLNKSFTYTYDKLDRLTAALSSENNNERIGYNIMGNITRLQRHSAGTLVDQIRYNYSLGNQLSSVLDSNANVNGVFQLPATTNYSYDGNGNMTQRTNVGNSSNNISDMSYNILNLPSTVNANGSSIVYTYDAEGNKLKKQVSGNVALNYEYIDGIQYENGLLTYLETDEGRVVRISPTNYSYEYVLNDHLGNGRVYFNINSSGVAQKIQETDYFGFGLAIMGSVSGAENKFQYNGKEKQDQEKMYDYGARLYDPVIGRWSTVDQMSEEYADVSPYNYVGNNPISNVDPNGMWFQTINGWTASDESEAQSAFKSLRLASANGGTTSFHDGSGIDNEAFRMVTTGGEKRLSQIFYSSDGTKAVDRATQQAKSTMFAAGTFAIANPELAEVAMVGSALIGVVGVLNYFDEHPITKGNINIPQIFTDNESGILKTQVLPKPPKGKGAVPPSQRDPKRVFTKKQREKMLEKQKGKCASCGLKKTVNEVDAHHLKRHADGGKTIPRNGSALCKDCHIKIHQ